MNLHIIQKQTDALSLCLSYTNQGDPLVITSNHLYHLLRDPLSVSERQVFILDSDLEASGLKTQLKNYEVISYKQFIELSLICNKVVTW
ncbi:hypothetical protein D5018_16220 [Parashewanella curva]|uniref:Sulfurtransferase complex subunit TusB n=1 Tax=Parashewanella curva TaxID=2338552 RepID=A0A3L8PTA0_9GAMM|nr:DsrH/TusB family sulfur metabolism protein [Parashewanella curva]RLV58667.1 hypothetical protein D5018_16220 [Parashewanella curva]